MYFFKFQPVIENTNYAESTGDAQENSARSYELLSKKRRSAKPL
jgi:hypothetical protein